VSVTNDLVFERHILDNVHGYIGLTPLESKIEKLPIFKRLQDISQLGLVRRLFPGALHNRYIHSLGVMHMVDRMAMHIGEFSIAERRILRLAGLLHDIGHYPLSHDLEKVYMQKASGKLGSKTPEDFREKALDDISEFIESCEEDYIGKFDLHLTLRKPSHHEKMARIVLESSSAIKMYIAEDIRNGYFCDSKEENGHWKDCRDDNVINKIAEGIIHYICAIIEGHADYEGLVIDNNKYFDKYFPAFLQLMHSELDADRMDYMLRDASFSGLAFSTFDLGLLLQSLAMKKHTDKWKVINGDPETYSVERSIFIVGVKPEGVACADQFLLNRYLAYTQIIHHKYASVIAKMLRAVVHWMIDEPGRYGFYDVKKLKEVISKHENDNRYYAFTDTSFFAQLAKINNDPDATDTIKKFADLLSKFSTPKLISEAEKILSDIDKKQKEKAEEAFSSVSALADDSLPLFYNQKVTAHLKKDKFEDRLKRFSDSKNPALSNEKLTNFRLDRLMEGLAVIDSDEISLLIDHKMSSLRHMSDTQTTFYREYKIS